MRGLKMLLKIISGKAVVITENKDIADVVIGKSLKREFVVGSLVGAAKHLML